MFDNFRESLQWVNNELILKSDNNSASDEST